MQNHLSSNFLINFWSYFWRWVAVDFLAGLFTEIFFPDSLNGHLNQLIFSLINIILLLTWLHFSSFNKPLKTSDIQSNRLTPIIVNFLKNTWEVFYRWYIIDFVIKKLTPEDIQALKFLQIPINSWLTYTIIFLTTIWIPKDSRKGN